jgi:hypothetical protein
MKKLFGISFLLAVLCLAAPVYAEGDMPTGSKTCTQNCSGLYDETAPTASDNQNQNDSPIVEIYSWIYEQVSELIG